MKFYLSFFRAGIALRLRLRCHPLGSFVLLPQGPKSERERERKIGSMAAQHGMEWDGMGLRSVGNKQMR
jgi:hypothetical protein